MEKWTILKLIEWTAEYFKKHGIPNPRLDAELLLAHILNKKRIELYLCFEQIVSAGDLAIFKGYIQRRIKREPLQYITGVQEFYGIPIKVTPAVLIPRPETELMVEKALSLVSGGPPSADPPAILDLCTGSGAILAAMASRMPNARLVGTDISEDALGIAEGNTRKWNDRIRLLKSDLFDALRHPDPPIPIAYDLIITNPPYIAEGDGPSLQPEVRDFEPKEALFAAEDGLAMIKKIINDAPNFMKKGGHLIMEIGDGQAEAVRTLVANNGSYARAETVKDYGGIERILITSSVVS